MRRAEWRRLRDEPTNGFGLLRQALHDVEAMRTALELTLGLMVVVAVFAFLIALVWIGPVAIACFIVVDLVGLACLWPRRRHVSLRFRKPAVLPQGLEAILPLPLPEDTFPVHVAVRFRRALTGTDLAAATFVDGWLHVEGRRAAFALRATDGHAERRGNVLRLTLLDGQRVELSPAGEDPERAARFRHAAGLWVADREHPEGEPILPPLAVHPSLRHVAHLAAGLALPATAFGLLALVVGARNWPMALLSALGLLASALALATGLRRRAADRRARTVPTPQHSLLPPAEPRTSVRKGA